MTPPDTSTLLRRRTTRAVTGAAVLLALAALMMGCGSAASVDDARAELARQRDQITAAADSISRALDQDDLAFEGATRRTGGDPGLRVQFVAEATWSGGAGSQERRIGEVADAVEGLGWMIDQRSARLVWASDDGLRVKASPAALRGSDDVLISLQGPVIEAPEGALDELVPVKPERLRP